ncbi:MAG: hypothetical protein RL375_4658 [Pseudomonadota bacterium]
MSRASAAPHPVARACWLAPLLSLTLLWSGAASGAPAEPLPVLGPAALPLWNGDVIDRPLTAQPGEVERGRAIVASRQTGLCLLCHSLDSAGSPTQGNLAPPLAGAGSRWSTGQLRARLVDSRRLDPASIMPAYFVVLPRDEAGSDLAVSNSSSESSITPPHGRVARAWQGRSLLDAQQIEDVLAYLSTLRDAP